MTKRYKPGEHYQSYGKNHYQNNAATYKQKAKKRRQEIRQILRALKDKPCMDCGIKYPYYVMDFDHRNPKEKVVNPALISLRCWGEEKIKEELVKCDLVCSNCHRERTHKRNLLSAQLDEPLTTNEKDAGSSPV